MKKKLAALDIRIQFGAIAFVLILLAVAGYMFVVSPQGAKANKLQQQADAVQTQIYQRRAAIRKGLHPPTIETADLFRLARAMPDRQDMPGIILTLSELARSSGIKFDLIEPVDAGTATGSYQTDRIHLLFNGDFYGLSDFLYRMRSLVSVHNGTLDAHGRLFNVDTLTFNVVPNAFPKISAELFVNAYVYGAPTVAAPATPSTSTTTSAAPDGATAAGVTP
ncbi:MAG TPA: type 4a pilus biogenesis protein PilO [Gaiellaceae bacterium]|nr:type 4a pilus biogenesis protein PilO [Thermoleophilia bacterium]HWJ30864.1 type 4a pilus biogenesis protein PilO [Gaiellaceae bacterium]